MKKLENTLFVLLPALLLTVALLCSSQLVLAQSYPAPSGSQAQDQKTSPDDQNSEKTFTGMIMKSGDKLILSDTTSNTTYQLDDQQKAQAFVNKTVKVKGVLDPASGTIHVSAINPV
jgi:hypothetical protein